MKRNLSNIMHEGDEDLYNQNEYETFKSQNKNDFSITDNRRGSFGNAKNTDSDRFGTSSTPKMGHFYDKNYRESNDSRHNSTENHNIYKNELNQSAQYD